MSNPTRMEIQDAARRLHDAGLWLTPIKTDGSKSPVMRQWNSLRRCWAELRPYWNCHRPYGIGIVLGETWTPGTYHYALDFDDEEVFEQVMYEDVITATPCVATPGNGYHCHFLTKESFNTETLAADGEGHPLVEMKGTSSKVIAPGGPLSVHPTGKPYRMFGGDLCDLPELGADELRDLIVKIRQFDRRKMPSVIRKKEGNVGHVSGGLRPGDWFNQLASWDDVLLPLGWKRLRSGGNYIYWQRPGATSKNNDAATNEDEKYLHVYSSSCHPLEAEHSYTKFNAYALLYHGGDWSKAASQLQRQGFGAPVVHYIPETCFSGIKKAGGLVPPALNERYPIA